MTGKNRFQQSLALSLVLFISSSTYAPVALASVGAPCDGSTVANASPNPSADPSASPTSDSNNQKNTYCAAARTADEAASAQKTSTIIWSTVAAVCTTACVANLVSYGTAEVYLGRACMISDFAGMGADLILTLTTSKKFSDSVTSLGAVAAQGAGMYFAGKGVSTVAVTGASATGSGVSQGGVGAMFSSTASTTAAETTTYSPSVTLATGSTTGTVTSAGGLTTSSSFVGGAGSSASGVVTSTASTASVGTGTTAATASQAANQAAGQAAAKNAAKMSCTAAAISAATAIVKGIQMGQSDKSKNDNLQKAQQLADNTGGSAVSGGTTSSAQIGQANTTSSSDILNGSGTATTTVAANTSTGATWSNISSSCSSSQASGNAQAFISCATADNPRLHQLMSHPDFIASLEKASGMPAGNFFKSIPNSATPGEIMAAGMGGIANAQDMKNRLAGVMSDLNGQALTAMNAQGQGPTSYASTGKAPSLSAQTDNLLGSSDSIIDVGAAPGETVKYNRATASLGVSSLDLKTDGDGILMNRSLSLFDVVTRSYNKAKPELETRPWSLPLNKYGTQ